jgi:N-acylneuraminate cytidylyltransferase
MKIIAFIPVRGGSKSIPMKNIKLFCGKPLVYWNISALQKSDKVDEIIVATDSEEIKKAVNSFNFDKVKVYNRTAENATDTASTESVMLEYINQANLDTADIFMLVQATSPLTETKHFDDALTIYLKGQYDSMLTCVRFYRFLWNENGTSKNYNYEKRPRRQDFGGELMENGAFYINTVDNIRTFHNRLCGKIGIYEMPDYTAAEIDEPDDWVLLESLMYKNKQTKRFNFLKQIKLFLTDVDGVLTDGGMYYSESGDEMKRFNTSDGMAFEMLRRIGVKTGIITSENTKIVEARAKKLKVDYLYQGARGDGKLDSAKSICEKEGINLDEVAYIGDDINDIELLKTVGFSACPHNAPEYIKEIVQFVTMKRGGEGAFREFVEVLLQENIRNKILN